MSGYNPAVEDPLAFAQAGDNLTYFAFAAGAAKVPAVAPARQAGPLPELLGGRYRLEGLLGAGGMGMVYRARDLLQEQFGDPDPYVAIKLLREDVAECPDGGALLYSEYALTRHLLHRHIVRVHHFDVDPQCQQSYFCMELVRGMPMDQLLCERPRGLPWHELRGIVLAMLEALSHAHQQGVVHGDIKPSNVILGETGVRLFDFGLGQAMEGVLPGLPQLSRDRFHAWTPNYAAPELFEGAPLSPATDVYAAACVIYELAGGKHPFSRLTAQQPREQRRGYRLKRPRNLPPKAWPALRLALAQDAKARSITVQQLHDAIAPHSFTLLQRWFNQRHG
ncbi:serine-threonine kinase Stk1 [Pseudomonas sp. M47T1]|uniref:serine/threonine-protein kinase n=1 Tax=unclassified Pseudomonas TaxID=196821 RepID=UPI00026086B2|nr:serine/threonine-protein kinase [Pseudomonas sp. M47T1]EIK93162.1 serine-threonine kinase Stk1 [Pseudomonas sp. M47T1]